MRSAISFFLLAGVALASNAAAQAVHSLTVTPATDGVLVPVVVDVPDPAKFEGRKVLGMTPAGKDSPAMAVQVVHGKAGTQLVFILPSAKVDEAQKFDLKMEDAKGLPKGGFEVKKEEGKHIDLVQNGRTVTRLMTEFAGDFDTGKVFSHVFDETGGVPLTKGAGGKFPHHRGIFLGWSKTGFQGKSYDTWHLKDGVNLKFEKLVSQSTGPILGQITARIQWNTGDGTRILNEDRTITAFNPVHGALLGLIEVDTVLSAPNGDVVLDGDPEHAGCQFRPSNLVAELADQIKAKKAPIAQGVGYLFHQDGVDPKKDKDLPWAAASFTVGENRYFTQHMSHPTIPKGNVYSAYRDYGRFGAYFKHTIKKGESLRLRYRFLVGKGKVGSNGILNMYYNAFGAPPKVKWN